MEYVECQVQKYENYISCLTFNKKLASKSGSFIVRFELNTSYTNVCTLIRFVCKCLCTITQINILKSK